MSKTIHSYCHYCLCLCGIKVTVEDNQVRSIEPDRENPYTWGDFCRKGKTAAEVVAHPQRLTTPMKRVGDRYVPATYEEAISDIASRLNRIIDKHGKDAFGTYHGNPLGFSFSSSIFFAGLLDAIGSGNRYWVGSVDQNNTHVVQEAMYGSELISIPGDVDDCKFFLLVGMDPAQSKFGWVDVIPNGWNRALEAQRKGAEIVIVDPRRSVSAQRADRHVAILPGQDWAFLLGLLKVIYAEGLQARSTAVPLAGSEIVEALTREVELDDLAQRCGIDAEVIGNVARRFAASPAAMCITHTGVSHTQAGTLAEWLGHVLNAVTDRLDTPGGKRYERGYVDLAQVFGRFAPATKHRTRLRDLPTIAGFHSLAELPDEITTPGEGQIRAMMIAGGNPVVSGPDGAALDKALGELELLVAVDIVQRESHRHAHWLIPGTHFLEREGLHALTAGLMDRPFAQYAQQSVKPPLGVKEEWEFFTDLALAMNKPLFGVRGINAVVRASRFAARKLGKPGWALNPRWIERALVASGRRLKFKDILAHEHGWIYGEKSYGDLTKALRTPDKRVQLAPPTLLWRCRQQLADRRAVTSENYPLLLINRRSRESMNSWLNETPGLFEQQRSNSVEMHPQDAETLGLYDGQRVRLRSPTGAIDLPVSIIEGGRPGVVTVAHGWGSRIFDPRQAVSAGALGANRNLLVDRMTLDPMSQTPVLNGTAVRIDLIESPPDKLATDHDQPESEAA